MHAWLCTCMTTEIIQHELLHILDFNHEQSRPDRDSYISIQWPNIQSDLKNNSVLSTLQTSYGHESVMLYDPYSFNKNGLQTIISTQNSSALIGQRIKMSPIHILELKRCYDCLPKSSSTNLQH
ncbi:unnamed protein product [Rotaria sp. Silwood2]|nr:unnamed protein product [Rotaria sp. Silwood2]CAF2899126.1 unnamed protein product [Rotaria sp. Silwood2]CAF3164754.1 unnamed protein product [Rotaria sp. Silwood2]CAF3455228.1 unnamed protein product [Rotaria sp. Silwood2]CAF4050685.1 unnamed protein product [Rotaria sp. Silwood2]